MDLNAINPMGAGQALGDARLDKAESAVRNEENAEAARELETLFAQLLVKEMRKGLGDGFFGEGAGSDTFEAWLDEGLASQLVDEGALDLAGRVKVELDRDVSRREAQGDK